MEPQPAPRRALRGPRADNTEPTRLAEAFRSTVFGPIELRTDVVAGVDAPSGIVALDAVTVTCADDGLTVSVPST